MTLHEVIESRHSVRKYINQDIPQDIIVKLQNKIETCNRAANLHIQLVLNEPKAYTGLLAYGRFSGVRNYFVLIGKKDSSSEENIGYYGEQLVLYAQQLGLNTCWTSFSYRKVNGAFQLDKDEKLLCMIAVGYGETQGNKHNIKIPSQVSNMNEHTPEWFNQGVKAALLAPTAINQQKFYFKYVQPMGVKANKGHSIVGYTNIDLGIAKLHFEIGAGKENFKWM